MADAATIILETMCDQVFADKAPAYFILDESGDIREWGGCLDRLDLSTPVPGTSVSDIVLFMEGILPLDDDAMEFDCIKLPSGVCVDARILRIGDSYGLLLWDSSEKESLLAQTQQKCNELSLLIEAQKRQMTVTRNRSFVGDLFQALGMVVLVMNPQGRFVLLGSPPPWFKHIPGADRLQDGEPHEEDVFSFLGNFIRETKSRWQDTPRTAFKSGIWIEQDGDGNELMFEATAVDVQGRKMILIAHDTCHPQDTQSIIQKGRNLALHFLDLKRSDRELKSLHDELESRVKQRTQDLREVNEKLAKELKMRKQLEKDREEAFRQLRQSQKMEAIGTLAGGIAHDFNNILAAIIGFSELSILKSRDDTDLSGMLEKILSASNRAKDLVRQILTFSHQTEQEKTPVRLKSVVTEALHLLRASIPASVEIHHTLKSRAYVLADPTQMHQVVMNLCANANHAMAEKGGTLTVSLRDALVEDLSRTPDLTPGPYLELTVTDTGCGISPDLMERIFDPYFTTRDKDKGTGLGLSVVHGIVAKTGGAITVDSQPGQGSRFTVYIPAVSQTETPRTFDNEIVRGRSQQILFVDDEPLQTEAAQKYLQRLGYKVITAHDGPTAWSLFMDAPTDYDLLITDLIMPRMSGRALEEKIRGIRPDLPVILCSGYSEEPEMDATGAHRTFLMKPVGLQDLAKAVEASLAS